MNLLLIPTQLLSILTNSTVMFYVNETPVFKHQSIGIHQDPRKNFSFFSHSFFGIRSNLNRKFPLFEWVWKLEITANGMFCIAPDSKRACYRRTKKDYRYLEGFHAIFFLDCKLFFWTIITTDTLSDIISFFQSAKFLDYCVKFGRLCDFVGIL